MGVKRFLPPLVIGGAVFLALSVVRWLVVPEPPPPPEPAVLNLPEMLGCWELDTGEWFFTPAQAAASAGTVDSVAASISPDSASMALLVLPDQVLLLSDSIDEWRREYVTYRAAPVAGEHDPRLADYLRWFIRADTLWLVWSDRSTRAGLALLAGDDRLTGAGRAYLASSGGDRLDGRVSVSAWKVNCATGLTERKREGPRP
jgi:hypothetical protein